MNMFACFSVVFHKDDTKASCRSSHSISVTCLTNCNRLSAETKLSSSYSLSLFIHGPPEQNVTGGNF